MDAMLAVALEEARLGRGEGGIPIGGALFRSDGTLLGRGRNRRVQDGNPSIHGEAETLRDAGPLASYADTIMVTTLAPCDACTELILRTGIGAVVVGDSETFRGGLDHLRAAGIRVTELRSQTCIDLLRGFIQEHPEIWQHDSA